MTRPTKRLDLDKLVRSIKDGLTRAGVYRDDAQVIVILAERPIPDRIAPARHPEGRAYSARGDDPAQARPAEPVFRAVRADARTG